MPSTIEALLLGILVLALLVGFAPALRAAYDRGRTAEKHWGEVSVLLGLVGAFVLFLILIL